MLIRIVRLDHVGIFRAGVVRVPTLRKVTAFYGENGRGKSTLAAVLDSCARGKPELIQCRATIDEDNPTPHVDLVFSGGPGGQVVFTNSIWSALRSDMLVFDSQFVHDNVYTGLEVTSDNRKGLYEFALGDQAAVLQRLDALHLRAQEALRNVRAREDALRPNVGQYSIPDFVGLVPDPQIEEALRVARQRVIANRETAQIQARQDLMPLALPGEFALGPIVTQLSRTVEDLNQEAMALVRAHFARHPDRGLEEWVNRGRTFDADAECPFCGQETQHNDLISAYGQYFNEEFQQLGSAVQIYFRQMSAQLSEPSIGALENTLAANIARQGVWADLQPSQDLIFNIADTAREIRTLRETLERLFDEKRTHLLVNVIDDRTNEDMDRLQTAFTERMAAYNAEVRRLNALYAARKAEVAAGDAGALARDVQQLEALARRGTAPIVEVVRGYVEASAEHAAASIERTTLRQQHDGAMAALLAQYQDLINARLQKFKAGFAIEGFGTSHAAGQTPRATFRIALRGESIADLVRNNNAPSFPTALSDGDRRTLAVAFFLARLDLDAGLAQKIVVLDDPMASFDRNRREATVRIIGEFAGRCEQIIILSHDAFFLREIETEVNKRNAPFIAHKIGYGNDDDATFEDCNLAGECATEYMRHYDLISRYLAGQAPGQARAVAGALRILVEEYYKLRFPNQFLSTMTLGQFITEARNAVAGSPLERFPANRDALERFNAFASRFHHSNPNAQHEMLNENDLRHYSRGALSLIHDDGQSHQL